MKKQLLNMYSVKRFMKNPPHKIYSVTDKPFPQDLEDKEYNSECGTKD